MFRYYLLKILTAPFMRIPPDRMAAFLARIAQSYARRRDPETGLRFLLSMDERFYLLQSLTAITWAGGIHPKHRLMQYHRFFTDRIDAHNTVLDIGCGNGELAGDIAERTEAEVTGIDRNADRLNEARSRHRHENLQFILGDVTQTLPEAQYDTVVLSNVLEHIAERTEFLNKVIASTHAKRLLIRVPTIDRDWRVALKRELGVPYRLDPEHEIEYTKETFEEEMAVAGLQIVETQYRWGEIWCEAHPACCDGYRNDNDSQP